VRVLRRYSHKSLSAHLPEPHLSKERHSAGTGGQARGVSGAASDTEARKSHRAPHNRALTPTRRLTMATVTFDAVTRFYPGTDRPAVDHLKS
jgi:hypothetical protein